ncbi:hydrogenase [Deltaproteobacteria bacterium]|nr:hydrogenase [Deltaproteobacteria bacterium]
MSLSHYFLGLLLAPLLPGIINRIKAKFAGRCGKPVLQLYYDLAKLLRKDVVYSTTTSLIFRLGPLVNLGAILTALLFIPFGTVASPLSFTGDLFLAAYLLAMGRFALLLAGLDTGSAFEGMGTSREATFSAIAEPVFLLGFVPLGITVKSFSLSSMLAPFTPFGWTQYWPVLILLGASFFLILLAENCRIPVDDPTTHLELTMIHEAMILDHSGVELALIEYASSLKLLFFCAVVSGVAMPDVTLFAEYAPLYESALFRYGINFLFTAAGIFTTAILVGITESAMARRKLVCVPQLLALAGALTALSCFFCLR